MGEAVGEAEDAGEVVAEEGVVKRQELRRETRDTFSVSIAKTMGTMQTSVLRRRRVKKLILQGWMIMNQH